MGKNERSAVSTDALRELAAQKEKEWKQVQELRANSLELTVKELEKELCEEKGKFVKLKEDFKYNVKLLTERDAELEKYDVLFTDLKTSLSQKESDLSECKIKLDEVQISLAREAKAREEMQAHYQHRVREKQAELEDYRSVKDCEVQRERESLESVKRNLERQLRELEDEIDTQKRELTLGFDEALRKREHEFRKQADEMSSTVLAHEMKVKLLTKELEIARSAQTETSKECQMVTTGTRELEKQLKQKDWELNDVKAMKDAQIKELQQKLHSSESTMKRLQEEFQRKHSELDRYVREKEDALSKVKDAATNRERQLEEEIREMQSKVEDAEIRLRQIEWTKQDMERDKDSTIERLQDEVSDLKSQWDSQKSELNRENVSRDMELEALKETDTRMKTDLIQRKHDIERYKKELQQAMEREASLERSKAQAELDWQRRCENLDRQQYEKSEDLVKQLSQARDEAQATLKEKLRELKHTNNLVTVLTEDRDRALITLKQHGLVADKNIDLTQFENELPRSATEIIEKLQMQNENLRQVIHQMRTDMESLGGEIGAGETARTTSRSKGADHSVAAEYVKNLETEVRELKIKCRELYNEASDLEAGKIGQGHVLEVVGDNVLVKAHIEQLNNTIGSLRTEKVQVTAQSRKQQARIQYLEGLMDNLAKEPRDKQVQIEQLQYELAAQTRRHQAEQSSSKQRITDLEMQLIETRKEADEYMKANIERNTEVTAMGQELSGLKMELADGRPALNFGAQELLIQQLQDEIQQLRNQLKGQGPSLDPMAVYPAGLGKGQVQTTNATIAQLQNKLRMAAKQISQLAKEKQQLIEMGNRLRSKLNQSGLRPPSPPPRPIPSVPAVAVPTSSYNYQPPPQVDTKPAGELQDRINNKLSQLETLQYALTKQELAYKQRYSPTRTYIPPINVESSQEFENGEDDYQPKSILKKSVDFDKLSPVPENTVPMSRPKTAPVGSVPKSPNGRARQPISARSEPVSHRASSPVKDMGALRVSMSSIGGESLQEIWKMLDDEGTPRTLQDSVEGPFTGLSFPGDRIEVDPPKSNRSTGSFTVKGKTSSLKPKPSLEPKSSKLTPRAAGKGATTTKKTTTTQQQTKPKIRNYNVRSDRDIR